MRTITKIRFAEILLKIVYLINPAIKKRNGRAVVRRKNINWALDIREGIDLSIYVFGGFERDSINIYNKISRCDGLVVFDVGANIGSHTLLLASLVSEDSMIHSFEPTEFAYNKLSYNIGLNSDLSGKIICKQYFLSSTEQSKPPESVYSSWVLLSDGVNKHMHHRGVMKETSGALQTTIDEYCLVNKIQRIDFMKLDVDGYELDVLEGARETVRSSHPVVLFEYAPYVQEEHGFDSSMLISFFVGFGYEIFYASNLHKIENKSMDIVDGESRNLIAIHSNNTLNLLRQGCSRC